MLKLLLLFVILTGVKGNQYDQHAYKFIYERSILTYFNPNILKTANIYNTKFNRTAKTFSFKLEPIIDIIDLSVVLQTYVLFSNQYKSFPIRFSINICRALEKNYYGLQELLTHGNLTQCPIKPGIYYLKDFLPDPTKFPPNIPTGNYKLAYDLNTATSKFLSGEMYVIVELEVLRQQKPTNKKGFA